VSSEKLNYQDLVQLIEVIKSASDFNDFHLRMGEIEIELRRGGGTGAAPAQAVPAAAPAPSTPTPAAVPAPAPAQDPVQAAAPAAAAAPDYPPDAILVKSPMVGTFYRSPEPGAPPFADVGQRVEAGATVCIIEVMKLMNSLPAEQAGTVAEVLVEDGMPVEFGQVLMVLRP